MNNNINTSTCKKFNESYKNYFINTIKIDKEDTIYQYVFYCRESNDVYFLKGNSMNEIYYKILFEIDYNCCDDIYTYIGSEYTIEELNEPIELLKTHYFENDYYVFKEIKYMKNENNINNINNTTLPKINKKTEKEFNESYEKYYISKYYNKMINNNETFKYLFISCEYGEVFFIEGKSMEEVYYIILFKIEDVLYNIFDGEYSMKELKDPIKLFNDNFVDSDKYIFQKID